MRVGIAIAAALLLGSCIERKPGTVAFSVEDAAFIKKQGTSVIVGHAFRTKPSGAVVNAAGQVVRLIPATDFSRERFTLLYGNRRFVPHSAYPRGDYPDPRYGEYTRSTKAEANGRFAFENVAAGEYLVTTQITWGDEDALFREGGFVYDAVTVTGKEQGPVSIILSGN